LIDRPTSGGNQRYLISAARLQSRFADSKKVKPRHIAALMRLHALVHLPENPTADQLQAVLTSTDSSNPLPTPAINTQGGALGLLKQTSEASMGLTNWWGPSSQPRINNLDVWVGRKRSRAPADHPAAPGHNPPKRMRSPLVRTPPLLSRKAGTSSTISTSALLGLPL
jgi:hypothetical protein